MWRWSCLLVRGIFPRPCESVVGWCTKLMLLMDTAMTFRPHPVNEWLGPCWYRRIGSTLAFPVRLTAVLLLQLTGCALGSIPWGGRIWHQRGKSRLICIIFF